ncbi:NUDIX domain-containing protein [Paraburkholderia sp. SIMBA_030]|uniref:NUDIX domain-containing protein n=1 Tax=Paraburkholderia sp. SIMBA_030 TaxID=3085773 RepID=UPI00397A08DA
MPSLERARSTSLVDSVWRMVLRLGFPLARAWWHLRRPRHEGALIAIYVGQALLLVKSSYRTEWSFPGGSIRPGETPDAAAQREMEEEIGLSSYPLLPSGSVCGIWDGRRDRVHFFELHLDCIPELRLDNREIIAAHLASPEELPGIALTGAVAAYLGRDLCC